GRRRRVRSARDARPAVAGADGGLRDGGALSDVSRPRADRGRGGRRPAVRARNGGDGMALPRGHGALLRQPLPSRPPWTAPAPRRHAPPRGGAPPPLGRAWRGAPVP